MKGQGGAGDFPALLPHLRKPKGAALTNDRVRASYALIRYNVRTYRSGGVLAIIAGQRKAEAALEQVEGHQSSADRHEGWRYFLEVTDLNAGMDAAEATERRQAALEMRESKVAGNS